MNNSVVFLWVLIHFTLGQNLFRKYDPFEDKLRNTITFSPNTNPLRKTFSQKLDHFKPTNQGTWSQLYWTSNEFYKKGGPAYLWICGESAGSPVRMNVGYWVQHGKKHNAAFFIVEHRYYGSSQPTNNVSTENLEYLNTRQALADLANFIRDMNVQHEFPPDTKWIVFGGSYAGSLAAWLRLKYPHLVHGAVASSAPLLAKVDFYEYHRVLNASLTSYKEKCATDIADANKKLDKLAKTANGRKEINKIFRLCSPLDKNDTNISFFFANAADLIAVAVQYNKPGSILSIKETCDEMLTNMSQSVEQRYANVIHMMLSKFGESCLSTKYSDYIQELRKPDWETAARTYKSWWYQTCTEYGYYQTSSSKNDIFGPRIPIAFFTKMCGDIFGSKFNNELLDDAVKRTNLAFGALDINVGRVIYVHGSIDPWHALGLIKQEKKKNHKVIYIKGASHCEDLRNPTANDSLKLKRARKIITRTLDYWLKYT